MNSQCAAQVQQGDCQEPLASFQHHVLTVRRTGATFRTRVLLLEP